MYQTQHKIYSREDLIRRIAAWRIRGDKIVFTNGCFDLIHLGHVDYLEKARNKGDRLVLGLNSDQSVRSIKGENRPICDEHSRARVLAALEFVDAVVLFDEDTPEELIRTVQPDILVKGNDYQPEEIVGYDTVMARGGTVETIAFIEGYSTSAIIERIRA